MMLKLDPPKIQNRWVVPFKFASVETPIHAPEMPMDQAFYIDHEGQVHVFKYLGKLRDIDPPTSLDDDEDEYG
jgi:hypothetical protein